MKKDNIKINFNKHICEGWTVKNFIDELEWVIDLIMSDKSWEKPFKTRKELVEWCKNNQPYYKKEIPDVVNYFCNKYNIE